ncbi:FixH family protein [Flavobacteriaceae bacterium S356]|uniref:FixH family protein n=1 Tax=Asprobacillus argus TaxID=3076534 RepID=A0ABU3LI15_9FLAO|nr:FixH family protein [Flavobacteriaceae bacterium S356]
MKINWGTGIVITIVLFIGFIMYFVITMSTDDSYSHDLVTEKYYQKELVYQEKIDASENAADLKEVLKIERTTKGLVIEFPSELEPTKVKGKVFLYRPSNKQLDFEISISLLNKYLLVPDKSLLGGRWNITVECEYSGKKYLFKEEIVY